MSTAAARIRPCSTTVNDWWPFQPIDSPHSVPKEDRTELPAVVGFEHELARFQRAVGRERDATRSTIVKRIRTADHPEEFIQTTIRALVSSARPGRLDDAVDVLSQCGQLLPTFIIEVLLATADNGNRRRLLVRLDSRSRQVDSSVRIDVR